MKPPFPFFFIIVSENSKNTVYRKIPYMRCLILKVKKYFNCFQQEKLLLIPY